MNHSKKRLLLLAMITGLILLVSAGPGQAASFTLAGDNFTVGISNSGALLTDVPDLGVYPPVGSVGIQVGSSDFLTPGTAFEFFSVGVGGTTYVSNGYYSAGTTDHYTLNNPIGTTSVDKTVGTLLSAHTDGAIFTVGGATLKVVQDVWFDKTSNSINFSVDVVNVGSTTATNLVYARGLDPDQDFLTFGTHDTNNTKGTGLVTAVGPISGLSITIQDLSGGGVSSIQSFTAGFNPLWPIDPYTLLGGANAGDGDNSINMAWNIGTLDAGRSYQIDFAYNIVPLPSTMILFGTGFIGLLVVGRRIRKP